MKPGTRRTSHSKTGNTLPSRTFWVPAYAGTTELPIRRTRVSSFPRRRESSPPTNLLRTRTAGVLAAWTIAALLILCGQTARAADTATPKLLFENDRVKIWTLTLEPGQSTPVHTHELEEIVICLESSKLKILTPGPEPEKQIVYPTAGTAFTPEVQGVTHILTNAGEKRYRQISIELKE